MTTTRTLTLTIALFFLALGGCRVTKATDGMFDADGTLAHRIALETNVSDVCASATLAVQDEFATRDQIEEINRACAREISVRADSGTDFVEMGADGHVCMPHLGNGSGFLDMKHPKEGLFDFVPGICTAWE